MRCNCVVPNSARWTLFNITQTETRRAVRLSPYTAHWINLNYIWRFISYRAVNTPHLGYTNQSANLVNIVLLCWCSSRQHIYIYINTSGITLILYVNTLIICIFVLHVSACLVLSNVQMPDDGRQERPKRVAQIINTIKKCYARWLMCMLSVS